MFILSYAARYLGRVDTVYIHVALDVAQVVLLQVAQPALVRKAHALRDSTRSHPVPLSRRCCTFSYIIKEVFAMYPKTLWIVQVRL